MDDRTRVADQLTGQLPDDRGREELGRLDLLHHRKRLDLRSNPGSVIGLEGEEHDEPSSTENPVANTPNTPEARSPSLT
jgi:hypothetical protein